MRLRNLRIELKNLKAVSTNSLYTGFGKRRSKTRPYKYLENVVKFEFLKRRKDIESLLSSYNPLTDYIKITVYNELSNLIITKSPDKERVGCISKTALDVDNSFKALIDSLFKQIGINDAEICDLRGYKFQSLKNQDNIYLKIQVIDRESTWQEIREELNLV